MFFVKKLKKKVGIQQKNFFKSISKNILKNNRMYIRNMKDSLNYNNESKNNINLFLTDDDNYNSIKLINDVNKNDNKKRMIILNIVLVIMEEILCQKVYIS